LQKKNKKKWKNKNNKKAEDKKRQDREKQLMEEESKKKSTKNARITISSFKDAYFWWIKEIRTNIRLKKTKKKTKFKKARNNFQSITSRNSWFL